MLFFQNLNLRWFHRDLFPGIQFKNGEVRAPPATRVLVAGSRGGELFLFYIKVEITNTYRKESEDLWEKRNMRAPAHGYLTIFPLYFFDCGCYNKIR